MDTTQLKYIVEAALLAAGRPLDLNALRSLFGEEDPPEKDQLRAAVIALQEDYSERGIVLQEVASGFRIQVRGSMSGWLSRLWEERTPRYSRALLETLAIIAYRQPVTRGDVEDIRGVGVTTNIMRTLLERNWIRVVGFRDVPGKPAMYGTTKEFLDYFGLRRLDDLPPLADIKDLDSLTAQLDLGEADLADVTEIPAAAIADDSYAADDFASTEFAARDVTGDDTGHSHPERAAGLDDPDEEQPDAGESASSATVIPLRAR